MYTISKKENNNRKTKTEQTKDTRRIILMVSIIKVKNEKKANKGITLIALVITILFSYDEKLKCSNSKGFLLATI